MNFRWDEFFIYAFLFVVGVAYIFKLGVFA